MADKYLSIEEALDVLQIDEDKFETLISNGEIKAFRTQGKVKFKEDDVNDLASRLESINIESVVDDDELPSVDDSSEVMPAVEMESLEDSDFTIELPDEVVSGDPSGSASSFSLEDDSLVLNVDDFGLEESDKRSDINPSDITIHEDELDLDVDDDGIATSDITLQDEVYGTSELTVQEEAINTADLTVQEDAVNTSELTISDDDGYGTEANLTVDDGEIVEEDEEEDTSRSAGRRSSRRSSGRMPVQETTSGYLLFVIFASLSLVAYIWALLYILPYHFYKNNDPLGTKTVIPDYVSGQRDWMKDQIIENNKDNRIVDAKFEKETFSNKAPDNSGEGSTSEDSTNNE